MILTLTEVAVAVDRIKRLIRDGDDVKAHVEQDELYENALETIAEGHLNAEQCEAMAAKAFEISETPFTHWYE